MAEIVDLLLLPLNQFKPQDRGQAMLEPGDVLRH